VRNMTICIQIQEMNMYILIYKYDDSNVFTVIFTDITLIDIMITYIYPKPIPLVLRVPAQNDTIFGARDKQLYKILATG
jgi:hypothetical protein